MKKISLLVILPIVFIVIFLTGLFFGANTSNTSIVAQDDPLLVKFKKRVEIRLYPTQPRRAVMFQGVVLATKQPLDELAGLVGGSNVSAVLGINRIDRNNLRSGMTVAVPSGDVDIQQWQYMPSKISTAKNLSKLIIVSQPIQAFGVYENGLLVRSGPVSSGKESNQTAGGLFFVNWKGEEVISTFDDEWILRWNMNIDNFAGISLHQYSLPGYPASHSCIRLREADAHWLYGWTDEWTLDKGKVKTEGTPVIVYGEYDFDNPQPWTLLPEDPKATDTPRSVLEKLVKGYLPTIKSSIAES